VSRPLAWAAQAGCGSQGANCRFHVACPIGRVGSTARPALRRISHLAPRAGSTQLATLVNGASTRADEHKLVTTLTPVGDGTFKDAGMANDAAKRHHYREFKKVIEMADVILEVLDNTDAPPSL
jgi:hypothetical protein